MLVFIKFIGSTSSFSTSSASSVLIDSPQVSLGTSYIDTAGLTANTEYHYWLKACNTDDICSGFSVEIATATLVAPPLAPTSLTATPNSTSQITINWQASIGASIYKVYRSTSSLANSIIIVSSLAATSYADTGLTANTEYYYWLKACNNNDICSNYSASIATTTSVTPPAAPIGLTSVADGTKQITINWLEVADANYYEVYRSTSSYDSILIAGPLVATTSYVDTGLIINTIYYYWLKACKTGSICSEYSGLTAQMATAATPAPIITLDAGVNKMMIKWLDTPSADYYELYRGTSSFNTSREHIESFLVSDSVSYLDTGLIANTTYYYWLKSCKIGSLCSIFSENTSAKTRPLININDTGITSGGNYPSGVNSNCSGVLINQQDCSRGRDVAAASNTLVKVGGGMAGFDYTKLAASGLTLTLQNETWSDTGTELLGTKWSCVRDNHTGLVWEVKNNDGTTPAGTNPTISDNIHHKDNLYRWGGLTAMWHNYIGTTTILGLDYFYDWNDLVLGTNKESLCGFNDWQVPTTKQLNSLLNRGIIEPFANGTPAIDNNYFPNGVGADYWSSIFSTSTSGTLTGNEAWSITLHAAHFTVRAKDNSYRVRLVRTGQ